MMEVLGKDAVELGITSYSEFRVIPDDDDVDELGPRK